MPSLYTRANNEYINQDELAKRIAFERTISQVNKYYGDEKEVSIKPGQLTSQLRYGFDSLFENFRNAIEQVLAEEYNGDLTNQKTYEVIKKYNQLSSYLKNIMNMKQLSDKDQEEIQAKFNELKDKLNLLKKIAIDNQFLDSDDIVEMVDKLNNVTTDKRQEIKSVPATSAKMVKTLENKTDAEKMISDSTTLLQQAFTNLQDQQLASSTKLNDFNDTYTEVAKFFSDPANLDPLEYPLIKENYDALKELYDDSSGDIKKFTENRAKIVTTVKDVSDNLAQTDADLTDFINKADIRVVDSIDLLKNTQLQYIADDLAAGTISQQEATDETNKINKKYDAQYYANYRKKIDKALTDYRQKVSTKELDPITQAFAIIKRDTATDIDLLGLTEDEITDILNELYKMNPDIDKFRKKFIQKSTELLDAQQELKAVAQPPQVERKQKEPDKPPEKLKKTVKKAKFVPYDKIGSFAKKYRDSANEYFNQTTAFTIFPKYLFGYITNPPLRKTTQAQAKATAEIQAKINNINAQSVKTLWGDYLKMSLAEKEAYFT